LLGAKFLQLMGISLNSFRIAGGTLLFLIALEMVFARPSGTLATILLTAGEVWGKPVLFLGFLGVVALVIVISGSLMIAAPRLMTVLGVTGANVMNRLSGVVLAALAVQFIVDGVRGSFLS